MGNYNSVINSNTLHFGETFTSSMEKKSLEFFDMMKYKS